jgi:short chain dehydrogenase
MRGQRSRGWPEVDRVKGLVWSFDAPAVSGLKGRIAVITGAGQGLGRAFAHAFAAAGAIPIIAEVDAAKATKVATEISALNRRVLAVPCDVTVVFADTLVVGICLL